ncbi:carnitine/acyl carnitine carrier [Coprinopsis cinerea AmutBmut pab1-1]|nr:carnitine/acyl carnitine carrier [Coprinopsis cinerea AmutBmut pab1-1]
MASLAVGFPFDTVKVRFQSPAIASKYTSTFSALRTIMREEKLIGLYRGITSPMATVALMNGLVFASYRFLMKLQLENADDTPTLTQIALAGAGSGIVSSLITTPTELIKIRQQSIPTPSTARQVAWQIFRESGIKGLYRGITATALRDTGYGAYFFAYEATCRLFAPPARNSSDIMAHVESEVSTLSWPALLFAGGVAGIAGWLFTFPFDVVKTRIQASKPIYSTPSGAGLPHHHVNRLARGYATATLSTPLLHGLLPERTVAKVVPRDTNPYRSTWSTIVNSYRSEGVGVFFRGLSPTLIRAIPVNMVTFATFEACVAAFS